VKAREANLHNMATPKLTHVFDLIMTGPAGFPYVESAHSNLCVAHGL
jgi:hypothetical protein